MEEQNIPASGQAPNQEQNTYQAPPTPAQELSSKKPRDKGLTALTWVLGILLVFAIGGVAYLYITQNKEETQGENGETSQQDESTEDDLYADWKTYTNLVHNYQIKYPSDWTLNTQTAEETDMEMGVASLSIEKDDYYFSLSIVLAGMGGYVCKFDDDICPETIGYACIELGESATAESITGKSFLRNETGQVDVGEQVSFFICEDIDGEYSAFITVGESPATVQYITPANPDDEYLEILDQIFYTLESTE